MAAMSNYLENALINEVLRATGYTHLQLSMLHCLRVTLQMLVVVLSAVVQVTLVSLLLLLLPLMVLLALVQISISRKLVEHGEPSPTSVSLTLLLVAICWYMVL